MASAVVATQPISPPPWHNQSKTNTTPSYQAGHQLQTNEQDQHRQPDLSVLRKPLSRIATHPTLSPFRRRVYRTLLSVPRGRWTTYSALARHLGSGPRAIGSAMKSNPFAPLVPCHRVLANNGSLGGYKGAWNNGGEYSVEKRKLLVEEGVVFDDKGRASGMCFVDFVELR